MITKKTVANAAHHSDVVKRASKQRKSKPRTWIDPIWCVYFRTGTASVRMARKLTYGNAERLINHLSMLREWEGKFVIGK